MINILRFSRRYEIDFETLINELAKKDLVFIEDFHSTLTGHEENQTALIKAILQKEKFIVGLEYESKPVLRHKSILELDAEKQYLGIPGLFEDITNRKIGFWEGMKKFDENRLKTIMICGEGHINHENGIPFKFNGSSQIAIVCQNPREPETKFYKIINIFTNTAYRNKEIYQILGRI